MVVITLTVPKREMRLGESNIREKESSHLKLMLTFFRIGSQLFVLLLHRSNLKIL